MKDIKWETLDRLKAGFKELEAKGEFIYMPTINLDYYPGEPYRSNYYGIGLLEQGEITFYIDLTRYHIQAPAIIFADTTSIKRWDKTKRTYEMRTILFSEDFMQSKLIENNVLNSFSDLSSLGGCVTQLNEVEFTNFLTLFKVIDSRVNSDNPFHIEVVRGAIYSMINEVAYMYEKYGNQTKALHSLDLRFREAVAKHCKQQRSVQFYAEYLHVHPKYLSHVISTETGMTASEWIQSQVVLEAKVLLQDHTISVGTIAEVLNFPDQSTFGKYFKKYAGISPSNYRENL
ncbi:MULTISPECIES: helix-turn-helix domain-containing protein [Myroides]|uniref:Helix-turn-helix domain-containing protein n=1 Tax=Myroides albus TaxID=2562892 RepID=A0A6I3LCP2_9FLAO|nr:MULTISPECIES: helix-turn-helix domain-containing protein [Myroides]MTG97219.1 helix-turn-helix domain-containing protein [Myroides albus]MVX35216.1 helix-turn-helix domain-containing protein [Myroides sp. LoEW2-1]UVD78960.1 helix-turn-helix domain-containing protein [Myroides albus]